MSQIYFLPSEARYAYTVDFSNELPNVTVTVTSITWTVTPTGVATIGSQADDLASARSTIFVSGQSHGDTYILQAKATLSNTEQIVKDIAIRAFNG